MLRGTLGAFIRGGLDTATQAIQQVNVSDEEKIVNKLQQFGASHDKYAEGLAEHNKESELITDVASSLSVQGDESLQDINEQDMRSLARTLITLSGATDSGKALEYFVNNRDNLAPKVMSTAAPAVEQTDQMLTDSDTATQQPKQRNFLQRIFQGKTDDQIKAEVINRAGVTEEAYDRIVAGVMPTRPDLTMGFSIGQEDKYKDVIKENQSSVLSAIRTGQPIFKTEKGKKLAQNYLTEHAAYMIGADGAKSGEEILAMQNDILTFASPPEAKNFFSVYDDSLQTLRTRLFGKDIKPAEYEKALPIFQEIMGMKRSAVANPKFAGDVKNADAYANKVFELAGILKVGSSDDQFAMVTSFLNDAVKHGREKSRFYTGDQLELLFKLPQQLDIAKQEGNTDMIQSIYNTLEDIVPQVPEGSDDLTDYDKKVRDLTEVFIARNPSIDPKKAELRAKEQVNAFTFRSSDGQFYRIGPNGNLQRIDMESPMGIPEPRYKVKSENNKKNKANINIMFSLGEQLQLLNKQPNGYNIIGDFILRTGDIFDMANSLIGSNLEIGDNAVAEIQRLRQLSKPLISRAKDALFEDPRLSDQDLRIVLDYVAIINDAGIGSTRATAALLGLTEAISTDYAMRMYENNRTMQIVRYNQNNAINIFDENGEVDVESTVAGSVIGTMAQTQGIKLLNKDEIVKLRRENFAAYKKYEKQIAILGTAAQRIVNRVETYRDSGSAEKYRTTYQNRSTLHSYGTIGQAASAQDSGVNSFAQEMADGEARWSNINYDK